MSALNQTWVSVSILNDQVTREETLISNLQDKIAQLDTQIADTQARIDVEKEQVSAMARAIYRQPDSLWMLIARTGNLSQPLQPTSPTLIPAHPTHPLHSSLYPHPPHL